MGKFSKFVKSAADFIDGSGNIPWSPPDYILDCKRELAEAEKGKSRDRIAESTMRLSRALVHSRRTEDRKQGIAMLEASLTNKNDRSEKQKILYLLAVGYYRSGMAPNSEKARSLKKAIEDQCVKDYWTGIGITVGGVVDVGGIAAVCGTGVVGGMAVRRGLMVAAGAACGIVAANKMAASAASPHKN